MLQKYKLLSKFFVKNKQKFNITIFFPILGLIIGTTLTSLTYSIMDSLQNSIINNITSISGNYTVIGLTEPIVSKLTKKNVKVYKIYKEDVFVSYNKKLININIKYIDNFDSYLEKLGQQIQINKNVNRTSDKSIYISDYISNKLNVSIGDTVIVHNYNKIIHHQVYWYILY